MSVEEEKQNQKATRSEDMFRVHNKVMVIDGEAVITGSFNFTKAADENNAENLLVIRDRKLAERYIENWKEHEKHSEQYGGRGQ